MSLPNPEPREIVVQLRWLGLRLWQRQDFFGFTEDSLALAEFVGKQPECQHICDLGSGSGGLLLLVWAKNQRAICQGLEIIPENVALAERSKQLNAALPGLLANCRFQQGDWRTPWLYFAPQSFDLLVSNPPYQPLGAGRVSPHHQRAAARTECFGSLAELLSSANWLLRPAGQLALVLPVSRQTELHRLLAANNFQITREQTQNKLLLLAAQKAAQ